MQGTKNRWGVLTPWAIVLIFIAIVSLNGEQTREVNGLLRVGVSKNSDLFIDWLRGASPSIEVIDLFLLPEEESLIALKQCGGLILSGGPDLDPISYGKPEKGSICRVDVERDRREWIFALAAIELKIPILGVCRGFHLLNVIFGGTLIADIPTETTSDVTHRDEEEMAYHVISITEKTLLSSIAPAYRLFVNSNHHQAIDRLADPFIPSARSNDQLIEAFEWKEKNNKPFLLAVEWHPKYMTHPFSKHIAEAFVNAVKNQQHYKFE